MSRGQITLFIILGVVILTSFMFLYAISSFVAEQQLEQQRQQIVQHPFDATLVQRFASVCVDDALKKGLEEIGRHGGYIFGTQDEPESVTANGEKILVGVTYRVQSPLYPCLEQFASAAPAFCRYGDYTGIIQYGNVQLPPLEGGLFSIEGILNTFISDYVENCLNLESFAADAGLTGYIVTAEDEPDVNVDFRDTDTYVAVDYPVSVDIGDGELSRIVLFESRVPVRFKQLYSALLDAAQKEVSNSSFSLDVLQQFFTVNHARVKETVKLHQLSPSVAIRSERIGRDILYTVEDPASRIENRRYVFRFLQKNRPPALEFVQKNPSYLYNLPDSDIYDVLMIKGEQVGMQLKAHEPDNDVITYSSSGDFGVSNGNAVPLSSLTSGILKQKITVSDTLLNDFQELRVLVDEPLTAQFAVRNYYGQEDVVSPEDPFDLDATQTKEQTKDPFARHQFAWQLSGLSYETENDCVGFPSFGSCGGIVDIESIKDLTSIFQGAVPIKLDATRTYAKANTDPNAQERVLSSSGTKIVTVVPCIVHDSTDEPYPFNRDDPYLARHACCEGNPTEPSTWQLKSASSVCHQQDACKDGFYLAKKSFFCSGVRGNMCGSDFSVEPTTPLTCGASDIPGCLSIPFSCERQLPWSIANGVWCYGSAPGATGCEQACDKGEVVYLGSDAGFQFGGTYQNVPGRTDFKCGCQLGDGGLKCVRTDGSGSGQCGTLFNYGKCV